MKINKTFRVERCIFTEDEFSNLWIWKHFEDKNNETCDHKNPSETSLEIIDYRRCKKLVIIDHLDNFFESLFSSTSWRIPQSWELNMKNVVIVISPYSSIKKLVMCRSRDPFLIKFCGLLSFWYFRAVSWIFCDVDCEQ